MFRLDQSTKPLFVDDLRLQERMPTQTLTFIVDNLDSNDALIPAAVDLAKRHVEYGDTPDHYASVGVALTQTFKQLLGGMFTTEDEAALVTVYQGLSGAMIEAAYSD